MEIQSLSVCVPAGCPNNCRFCVSKMHQEDYVNQIEKNLSLHNLYERDFCNRLQFARDNGCNTVILTGEGEPMGNRSFLTDFAHWNRMIDHPFRWIEIQTAGVFIGGEQLQFLKNTVEVSTLSLSLSDMFDSGRNARMNGTPKKLFVDIDAVCAEVKRHDFNLRLSLNMTSAYHGLAFDRFFERAKELGANQITFRKLFTTGDPSIPQNRWIKRHTYRTFDALRKYIGTHGRRLEVLPFGAVRYSVHEISTVLDDDCMSTEAREALKYLILRADCRLYTKWDDRGSLLF